MAIHDGRRSKPQGTRQLAGEPQGPEASSGPPPESTGMEAAYLRKLIDSRTPVTLHLTSGEKISGQLRYYDRSCLSVGLTEGPNLFVRKDTVLFIAEG